MKELNYRGFFLSKNKTKQLLIRRLCKRLDFTECPELFYSCISKLFYVLLYSYIKIIKKIYIPYINRHYTNVSFIQQLCRHMCRCVFVFHETDISPYFEAPPTRLNE